MRDFVSLVASKGEMNALAALYREGLVDRRALVDRLGLMLVNAELSIPNLEDLDDSQVILPIIEKAASWMVAENADAAISWVRGLDLSPNFKNRILAKLEAGDDSQSQMLLSTRETEAALSRLRAKSFPSDTEYAVSVDQLLMKCGPGALTLELVEAAAHADVPDARLSTIILQSNADPALQLLWLSAIKEARPTEEDATLTFAQSLLSQRPQSALLYLQGDHDNVLSESARISLLSAALAEQPQDALNFMNLDAAFIPDEALQTAMGQSTELVELIARSELLTSQLDEKSLDTAARKLVEHYGFQSQVLKELIGENATIQHHVDVLARRAQHLAADPHGTALSSAAEDLRQEVLDRWVQSDPLAMLDYVEAAPQLESGTYQDLLERVSVMPAAARTSVKSLIESNLILPDAGLHSYVRGYASSDADGVFEWIDSLDIDWTLRADLQTSALETVAQTDPYLAADWAARFPKDASRDSIIKSIIKAIPDDPERAIQWAASLSDETERMQLVNQLASRWAISDPATATSVLGNLDR